MYTLKSYYRLYPLEVKLVAMALLSFVLSITMMIMAPEPRHVVSGLIKNAPVESSAADIPTAPSTAVEEEYLTPSKPSAFVHQASDSVSKHFRKPLSRTSAIVSYVVSVSKAKDMDPRLVLSVISKESSFNPKSIGSNGEDYGLMQVNIRAHADKVGRIGGPEQLFNYRTNIDIGTDILKSCLTRFETRYKQLRCYNGFGPTSVNYPHEVMEFYGLFS